MKTGTIILSQVCVTLVATAVILRKIDNVFHRICIKKYWYYKDDKGKYHYC